MAFLASASIIHGLLLLNRTQVAFGLRCRPIFVVRIRPLLFKVQIRNCRYELLHQRLRVPGLDYVGLSQLIERPTDPPHRFDVSRSIILPKYIIRKHERKQARDEVRYYRCGCVPEDFHRPERNVLLCGNDSAFYAG